MNGNPGSLVRYTLASPELGWFAVFDYENSGYIPDDDEINADELLATLAGWLLPGGKVTDRKQRAIETWAVPLRPTQPISRGAGRSVDC